MPNNPAVDEACFHCGLPAVANLNTIVLGQSRVFCCLGCRAVSEAIQQQGLSDFYHHRETYSVTAPLNASEFTMYDLDDLQDTFIQRLNTDTWVAQLFVGGIRCAACVWLIEKIFKGQPGILKISVNSSSQRAQITFNPFKIKTSQIFLLLSSIGYQPQPLSGEAESRQWEMDQKDYLLRMAVAGIGMMQAGMIAIGLHAGALQGMDPRFEILLRWINALLTLPIVVYSAKPFFIGAWQALRHGVFVNDVSISLGIILAFLGSIWATVMQRGDVYFDSVAMFSFLLLLGRYLEKRARYVNFKDNAHDRNLIPSFAYRLNSEGEPLATPIKLIKIDDRIHIRPGQIVACDGVILEGTSDIDESMLTGEVLPLIKKPGDVLLAGAFNVSNPLVMQVRKIGADTQLAKIEQWMLHADRVKPYKIALADAIASKFVIFILLTALMTGVIWAFINIDKTFWVALSVLVVSCPCALSLATPTALTVAANTLRRLGLLLHNSQALESLQKMDVIVFDKTGTLTTGQLSVETVINLTQQSDDQWLGVIAALEFGSPHPIASAFSAYKNAEPAIHQTFSVGQGVSGEIKGERFRFGTPDFALPRTSLPYPAAGLWCLLAQENTPLCWVLLNDPLRASAVNAVSRLHHMGYTIQVLSGDRDENVGHIAKQLNIKHWQAGLLPMQKLEIVQALQNENKVVFMIGDGINDLPVLNAAQVSCAMGSATRLAQTKADFILLGEDLNVIPNTLLLTHKVNSIIRQNFVWAIAYNLCAIPFAAMGWIPPWMAAIGMSVSSLVVVGNSLRIGRFKPFR